MPQYTIHFYDDTLKTAAVDFTTLCDGASPGHYLQNQLAVTPPADLSDELLLNALLNTKKPRIYAESQVRGDGSDWNRQELAILGDIGMAIPVTVYDNGHWTQPVIHTPPFQATLLFTPGALLRNNTGNTPADWEAVTANGKIDPEKYYTLYQRRLSPLFTHADQTAAERGASALITVPGIGCGQFAGPFS